jgi:hypothetical protein
MLRIATTIISSIKVKPDCVKLVLLLMIAPEIYAGRLAPQSTAQHSTAHAANSPLADNKKAPHSGALA